MQLQHLMTILIHAAPPVSLGRFPHGERRLSTFDSGTFEGPGMSGTLLAGGADWQLGLPDGTIELRARYALRTDDGDTIEVISEGVRVASSDVAQRLAAGEAVDPSEYYFRTHIRMSTDSVRWARLNHTLAIASGERRPGSVAIQIDEVL